MLNNIRIEEDLLGTREVPADAYYGVHTLRAIENFYISNNKISDIPEFVRGMVMVKKAAALANKELQTIPKSAANAIIAACDEVLNNGKCMDQFPVDVYQGGAGTSVNMNTNEVLANIGLELMGHQKGEYQYLNPNDHVNKCQSTNDAYPTGFRIAVYASVVKLVDAINQLGDGFQRKAVEFQDILKMGRTQLQDAVPMTLGQEFHAFNVLLNEETKNLLRTSELLLDNVPLKLDKQRWQLTPWHLKTDDAATITAFLKNIQEGKALTLRDGKQVISLSGLKAALLFIDAQQKRVGSETAWIKKGDDPPLSVPPAPALKKVAVVNPTPTPLSHAELNDLLDYGTGRMNASQCSLDPNRREVRVTALTDDKALLIVSCEAGAYNTVDLAWLVSRKKPFTARSVRLRLPFTPSGDGSEMELMNASFDEKTRELTTLALGRGLGDCGIQTRWRFDGQRFRLVRYAEEPSCDNWNGPDAWPTLWITR